MSSSTSKKQRIGIWIITIAMVVGTIFSFASIIFININEAERQATIERLNNEYTAKVKELSDKYYSLVFGYEGYPKAFDGSTVTGLTTNDLKIGDGEVIESGDNYVAYYIGWTPDGKIFDQSVDTVNQTLNPPINPVGLISGWSEGVKGMKVGGVREITIPSDKAYGKEGRGETIKPDTPLKFIVFALPKSDAVTIPDYSKI